ncbi:MAG: sugar phosphate isomerase/epimerase [Ruminococcaceae bacterium]|nr:sugar phosphate isomerase/epimerase [Oscillospiraceae bacterium]
MKLSVVSGALGAMTLDEALGYLKSIGVTQFELGVGGYPGTKHADAKILSKDKAKRDELLATFKKHGMEISALSVHGNSVHPNKKIAAEFEEDFRAACVLAGQVGIDRIVTFSGCPGSDPKAQQPSWVTCPWPNEYLEVLDYQWNEVLIPYWKEAVKFAAANGVKRIALEMHPGFAVYNPETLLRLRGAVGKTIGANLDPSHLFWQGMDIVEVINALGDAIYYFHAKDTLLNDYNVRKNGVLDTKPYKDVKERSWVFRTMGYGNDGLTWKKIISQLLAVGYDDSISIEHEDSLMSAKEGLLKAVEFLKDKIVYEKPGAMWWV